jgi:hypothetical protein
VRPEAIFARLPYPPLSHSLHSQPPIGDELPPRRTTTTPPASHLDPCTSPSLFLSPMLPRHQRPLAAVDATQSMPAAPTGRRPHSRPRSDRVEHAPWMPRACIAFPLVHTSSLLTPHTILHGIKRAFTRCTRLACLRIDVSSP